MDEQTIRSAAQKHGQAVVDNDIPYVMADLAEELPTAIEGIVAIRSRCQDRRAGRPQSVDAAPIG